MSHGGARPGSGRPRGAKNRRTIEIEQKLKDLPCPFEAMSRLAHEAEEKGDLSTAGRLQSELAKYLMPQRKSVQVSEEKRPGLDLSLDQIHRLKEKIMEGDEEVFSIMRENGLSYGSAN